MHRTLLRAFPDVSRAEAGLLYRVFSGERDVTVYLQSRLEPDVSSLEKYGFTPDENGLPRDIGSLRDKFRRGEKFAFDLLCYPSKKVGNDVKNSRRVYLRQPEEREKWLLEKARQCGFTAKNLLEKTSFSLNGEKKEAPLHYYAVEFTGELTIEDDEAFWNGYCSGIGAGKAYGLGLLLLAR
jgi:CRISPR system Cascade subunit CasE